MTTREIKFRAWDEGNKVMHQDFEFIRSGSAENDWIVFRSDKQPLFSKPHPFENPYFSKQFVIMEFTGLQDMHGSDIYEGDIIEVEIDQLFESVEKTGVVEFVDGGWRIMFPNDGVSVRLGDFEEIEIKGNECQNPELLK